MAGLGGLIGLAILLIFVGGAAFMGYHIYLWSNELAERGRKKMEKKNMSFTADGGLRVGVKDIGHEAYHDKTQKYAPFSFPPPPPPPLLSLLS